MTLLSPPAPMSQLLTQKGDDMSYKRAKVALRAHPFRGVATTVALAGVLTGWCSLGAPNLQGPGVVGAAAADACVQPVPNLPPICTPSPTPVPTNTPSVRCAQWIESAIQCGRDASSGGQTCDLLPRQCP